MKYILLKLNGLQCLKFQQISKSHNITFWVVDSIQQRLITIPSFYRMSKLLTTMWSNFMKYGNPTPQPVDKIKWMPSSGVKREYLVIGKETKMASSVSLLRRLSIWKAVLGED